MQKIPLTVAGAEKLKAELQQLKSVARPEVIAELESKLSHAQIIDPKEIHAEGKIVFGATVTVSDLETDEEATYQIVGDDEADIKIGKISVNSPIARAMIGKEEGDVAEVQAPSGVREYDILNVQYI